MHKRKLIRLTTADISLDKLIRGQLRFLNQFYDVIGVASNTGLLDGVSQREGIRTIDIPMHRDISLRDDIHSLWSLYKLFRKEKPYILHTNTPKGSLLGMVAGWAARVPRRIYLVTGLRYQGATGMFRLLLITMERLACLFATHIIPEGEGVKRTLIADHITSKPLKVLHYGNINGIDTSYFSINAEELPKRADIRAELSISPDDFAFIFIGRIVNDKGMHELVQAIKHIKDTDNGSRMRLILVGSFEDELDPLLPEDKATLQSDPRVIFTGWQEDVRPYLLAADALVFPSYREGFPNAPMQAGAMNLPSIVTDINGCNEIITDGVNGRIVPPRDADALINAMEEFLQSPTLVAEMASKARNMIQKRYEQHDVWQVLLDFYQSL